MSESVLQLRNITKSFGSNIVLSKVNFDVRAGEVHVLMGENGAGKSTLMNIIAGVHHADSGSIYYQGQESSGFSSPIKALQQGIGLIHQELCLSLEHSVWRNVLMGREKQRFGMLQFKQLRNECTSLLKRVGAHCHIDDLVKHLSIAEQQLVEIARALRSNTQVMIMDEPTAALSETETVKVMELIEQFKKDNLAIIYISHRIKEVSAIADRVSVLRDGQLVCTLVGEEIQPEAIISNMVGRELKDFYVHSPSIDISGQEAALQVNNLCSGHKIKDVSFSAYRGQLTIIAGLIGAGRTSMAMSMAGAYRLSAGEIKIDGQTIKAKNIREAQREGIFYVPEDRKSQGLFLDMSCATNIVFKKQEQLARTGWRSFAQENKIIKQSEKDFHIRMSSAKLPAASLSGGNQQKLLIARNCTVHPKLLILDEPTRGVDIGAKQEVYRVLAKLVETGTIVVVISSDLMEVIGLRARVLVMHEGRLTADLPGDQRLLEEEEIMHYATGLKQAVDGLQMGDSAR